MFWIILYELINVPIRIPFEEKPLTIWVVSDLLFNVYMIANIVVCFLRPFKRDDKYVTNFKQIAKQYVFGTKLFWVDIVQIFPLSFFRYINDGAQNSHDDLRSFLRM